MVLSASVRSGTSIREQYNITVKFRLIDRHNSAFIFANTVDLDSPSCVDAHSPSPRMQVDMTLIGTPLWLIHDELPIFLSCVRFVH